MKVLTLLVLLMIPATAVPSFFFMMNDVQKTSCLFTPVETQEQAIAMLEKSGKMSCSGTTDKEGTIILTCEGAITHMFVFAATEARCNSLRESFLQMLEN